MTTVMLTGAAGNLGRAVAAAFAEAGANLVLLDLKGNLQESDRQLFVATDLLNAESVQAAVDQAVRRFKRIDVLCNLAGGFRMGSPVHETSDKDWNFLFDVNARTVLNTARAVVPLMLKAGGGKIVNVGAYAAQKGAAQLGADVASQSAGIRLTETIGAQVRRPNTTAHRALPPLIAT